MQCSDWDSPEGAGMIRTASPSEKFGLTPVPGRDERRAADQPFKIPNSARIHPLRSERRSCCFRFCVWFLDEPGDCALRRV